MSKEVPCIENSCILYPICRHKSIIECEHLFSYINMTLSKKYTVFNLFPKAEVVEDELTSVVYVRGQDWDVSRISDSM